MAYGAIDLHKRESQIRIVTVMSHCSAEGP